MLTHAGRARGAVVVGDAQEELDGGDERLDEGAWRRWKVETLQATGGLHAGPGRVGARAEPSEPPVGIWVGGGPMGGRAGLPSTSCGAEELRHLEVHHEVDALERVAEVLRPARSSKKA